MFVYHFRCQESVIQNRVSVTLAGSPPLPSFFVEIFDTVLISVSVILAMTFSSVYYPQYLQNISQKSEFFFWLKHIFR
jgi:hypothetical protein